MQKIALGILAIFLLEYVQTPLRALVVSSRPSSPAIEFVKSPGETGVVSVSADAFLSSLGMNIHIDQGYDPASYVEPVKYLGVRAVRTGADRIDGAVFLAQQTGVLVDIFTYGGRVSDAIAAARKLAAANALLSVEGPNEPNNFPIIYEGEQGGGQGSWLPVARFQRDLYAAVKADAELMRYPVFSPSETGAQNDNVGLQFLTIPANAGTLMPDGTRYADYANPHNYVVGLANRYEDNQAWNAADPTLNSHWDALYANHGMTWRNKFRGYRKSELATLPRVTTETGWGSTSSPGGGAVQATILVNTYLAQFKRGYRYTFIYQLRDGEGGDDNFGVFDAKSKPKPSATNIRNLTSILADDKAVREPGRLNYAIANQPVTVHDLLLQKSNGRFYLVLWGEKVTGSDEVTVRFGSKYRALNVYDVTVGPSSIRTLTDAEAVTLAMTDHALVVELIE